MYWSKVKTILIILFLCINIFLLINMIISVNQTLEVSADTVRDTVQVLQNNEIAIDAEKIPTRIEHVFSLTIRKVIDNPDNFAERVLGISYNKTIESDTYVYEEGSKALQIGAKGWKFVYTDTQPSMQLSQLNENTALKYAKKTLENWGLSAKYLRLTHVQREENKVYSFGFQYRYSSKNIYVIDADQNTADDSYIMVRISDQGVVSVQGYAMHLEKTNSDKLPGRHVTGVLIDFIREPIRPKDHAMTITDLSIGYRIDMSEQGRTYTEIIEKPVWRIATDDKSIYYLDAVRHPSKP